MILAILEQRHGKLNADSLSLVTAAQEMGQNVDVLICGDDASVQEAAARAVEQAAPNVVRIQSAETILKYPDFNAAEALGRMPDISLSSDTGEGRWTVQTAIERAIPAMALTTALNARFRSRREGNFADKVISAMRRGFGGHTEAKGEP